MDEVPAMLRARGRLLTPADVVLSLDLDGTVWFGDPPGPIVGGVVIGLQRASAVVGSASDRTVLDQRRLWQRVGIQPAFIVVKNRLEAIASQFAERVLVHIGDRFADELEAANAGAIFLPVGSLSREEWQDTPKLMEAIESAWHLKARRSVRDDEPTRRRRGQLGKVAGRPKMGGRTERSANSFDRVISVEPGTGAPKQRTPQQ